MVIEYFTISINQKHRLNYNAVITLKFRKWIMRNIFWSYIFRILAEILFSHAMSWKFSCFVRWWLFVYFVFSERLFEQQCIFCIFAVIAWKFSFLFLSFILFCFVLMFGNAFCLSKDKLKNVFVLPQLVVVCLICVFYLFLFWRSILPYTTTFHLCESVVVFCVIFCLCFGTFLVAYVF